MNKKLLVAAVAAGVTASPVVFAGNGGWHGFYLGGHAGAAFVDDMKVDDINNVENGIPIKIDDETEFTGGAQLGYNWQKDKLVFGVEADLSYLDYDGSDTPVNPISDGVYAASADWLGTLRARIGYAFDDKSLVYATGGLAFSDLEYSAVDSSFVGSAVQFKGDEDADNGWTVGAGFERKFNKNLSLKAEYLYVQFDGEKVTAATTGVGFVPTLSFDFDDTEMHIVRVGVNYRF